ncbi:thioredoxin domain-containing protein [Vineibacter terrae]|uniref:Thioredoxin domain-containing protein n=1 Tax=Vineibacter terrae TaxID=2586908 RepID=A0A5C8PLW4_9HYPH|nr:thioredoxin domain-containing protein [Vineibacter terrae]TXL74782.1 thioredoxin domain-containing protein [Vineibacter terrae]
MSTIAGRNRLADETSPYLLQHADNPVHWWPWGDAALAEARRLDRPILLSIGYAACHWCHVMAHESFESDDVAAAMNTLFINIKVDREERPDIDTIYQQALALLGQQGGWPLTMFCTPAGEPFWGGTYFPQPARYGRPAFADILRSVASAYRDKKDAIEQNREALLTALRERARGQAVEVAPGTTALPPALFAQVATRLAREVDPIWGGIGQAPKFPNTTVFERLWRSWLAGGRREAALLDAVTVTLDRVCQGGIYDHLGGGFARYATDAEWLIPHFEKMLYDNAQLVELLTLVWQETKSPLYRLRIAETCDWVLREMVAANGAFAATYDADSEGEEGKFYVWRAAEIDAVLGEADAAFFRQVYDVRPDGNWEHGANILHRNRKPALLSEDDEARLAMLRARLKAVRDTRVWPGWDDKVLADWNGLMIAALANAAAVFDRPAWREAATRAFDTIWSMRGDDGRLFHSWRKGIAKHRGTLDDHANMARAALALFETGGEGRYLDAAASLTEVLDTHFGDGDAGGYFFTAADASDVIVRRTDAHDSAVPSGNGTMVGVLARLWSLTGEQRYRDRAERVIAAFAGEVERNFFPLMTLMNNAELLQAMVEIVIVGPPNDSATHALTAAVHGRSLPDKVIRLLPPDAALPAGHPAAGKGMIGGRPTAYVCRNMACSAPVTEASALTAILEAGSAPGGNEKLPR